MQRNNAVVFLPSYADACALWRLQMPAIATPESSFYYFDKHPHWDKITGHDIVVVQRCCTKAQFTFIQMCASLGIRIVYDIDDNVWEIPRYNPAHNVLSAHREGFNACIRMVDVVSVSTEDLAKAVRRHVGLKTMVNKVTGKPIPVVVAENRIEKRLFAAPAEPDPLLVGWAGSSSHIGDLCLVEPAILALAETRPDVTFEFRGCVLADNSPLPKLAGFRHKLWTPVAEYAARMPKWRWSVALAPVQACAFNDAKSCIKMIEAGYCGIPCLASWVKPYADFCSHDPELKWLLCAGQSAWVGKLRELVNDKARREDLGTRMRAVVTKYYSFDCEHEGWKEVFASC